MEHFVEIVICSRALLWMGFYKTNRWDAAINSYDRSVTASDPGVCGFGEGKTLIISIKYKYEQGRWCITTFRLLLRKNKRIRKEKMKCQVLWLKWVTVKPKRWNAACQKAWARQSSNISNQWIRAIQSLLRRSQCPK